MELFTTWMQAMTVQRYWYVNVSAPICWVTLNRDTIECMGFMYTKIIT